MRVLITGGAGHIGKITAERLVALGWEVRVFGLESGVDIPGAEVNTGDLLNFDAVREQVRGCNAVIHLAALRGPQLAPGHRIFEVNVGGTFNVFEAAAQEGIKRVVQASSINALGCCYNLTEMDIRYFPIDEEHPTYTTDPYSFSKENDEEIGKYYWRREGISSVAMRFPGVYNPDYVKTEDFHRRRKMERMAMDKLAAMPDAERQRLLAELKESALEYREKRPLEFTGQVVYMPKKEDNADLLWHIYTLDRYNFWAFIDVRDAAQSLEKGVTAKYDGAHALYINDYQNWLGYDSRTLVHWFFPEISESNIALSGSEALVSINKARSLIGFEPEFSVEKLYSEAEPK